MNSEILRTEIPVRESEAKRKIITFGEDFRLSTTPISGAALTAGQGNKEYKSPVSGKLVRWRIRILKAYSDYSHVYEVLPTLRLYVFRETSSGNYYCVGKDSKTAHVVPGINEFETDILIQKEDFLFLNVGEQYVYCFKDVIKTVPYDGSYSDYEVGSTKSFGDRAGRIMIINADVEE